MTNANAAAAVVAAAYLNCLNSVNHQQQQHSFLNSGESNAFGSVNSNDLLNHDENSRDAESGPNGMINPNLRHRY